MLARSLPGVIVCVCPDRHLAGVLAERKLGATVHLMDDGFQHFNLARDLDVLVTSPGEITGGRVLPNGRLREPRDAAARAHVLVVMGATAGAATAEGWALGVGLACGAEKVLGTPRLVGIGPGHVTQNPGLEKQDLRLETPVPAPLAPGSRVVLSCGIANPHRFVEDVKQAGYVVTGEVLFGDHHTFSARDIARISEAVNQTGAEAVLTTDKDAVRFEEAGALPFALYRVPLTLRFHPPNLLFDSVADLLATGGRALSAAVATAEGSRPLAETEPATGRQPADGDWPS
jgi:tetraacyldisaccharide 4'-kinase